MITLRIIRMTMACLAVAIVTLGGASAQATIIEMDAGDTTGVTKVNNWIDTNPPPPNTKGLMNDSYHYATAANSSITYTPGSLGSFASGTYDLYTSWGVNNNHDTAAAVTVTHANGTSNFTLNQRQAANQGLTSSMPVDEGLTGSGWYFLGQFTLDTNSTVQIAKGSGSAVISDGIRLMSPDEGRLFDERSANITVSNQDHWQHDGSTRNGGTWYEYTSSPLAPGTPYLSYHYTNIDSAEVTVKPLESGTHRNDPLTAGLYEVEVSWSTYFAHTENMRVIVDLNGDGDGIDAGEMITIIDQSELADGTHFTSGSQGTQWSDFFSLGQFNLTDQSQILIDKSVADGNAMTFDVMRVTLVPEPATMVLLISGSGLMAMRRRMRQA